MRILHFSDFHLTKSSLDKDKLFTIQPFLKTLEELNTEQQVDLVVFSGDMIDKGGQSFPTPVDAFISFYDNVIQKVCATLKIEDNKFIIAPGNHDIVRNYDSELIENGCRTTLVTEQAINKFLKEKRNGVDLSGIQRIIPYKDFLEMIYTSSENIALSLFESSFTYKIDNKQIGVVSFNTSWRCYDNDDKGRLLIGEDQLINSLKAVDKCDYKIAILHHHPEHLMDFDRLITEKILQSNFDLLLCGHVHSADNKYIIEPHGQLLTLIAPGTLASNVDSDSKRYSNGFSVIDLNFIEGKITTTFYTYSSLNTKFHINTAVGKSGIWEIELPKTESIEREIEKQKLLNSIKEEHSSKCDTHLLTYNTDTDAPKSLMELFVQPKLTYKASIDSEKEEVIDDLMDVLKNADNYLFFGTKEAGKTLLLDRLIHECISTRTLNSYVPVYIEFSKISSDIVTNIRDYLLISKEATKNALNTHSILLLIDDLKLNNDFVDLLKIKQLIDLKGAYHKIKIICTYQVLFDNEIPEYFELLEKLSFKTITIKDFQSKQIRELTTKWFKDKELLDKPQKVETLINGFLALSLPRTPFAVSMFLWIIEKQQNYKPINNSTLIENFIEKLLSKHARGGILSESFDYQNKVRLLSEIAYKMLKDDRANYSDTHANVIQFISQYLRKKDFTFNVEKILNELVDCGIFIKDGNSLRFRFNCFFEYFLVKKMGYDSLFKKEVLDEKNYINFLNEIDYYTGLHRDDTEILKLVLDRADLALHEIKTKIKQAKPSIDDFFMQTTSQIKTKKDEMTNLVSDFKATEEDLMQIEDAKLLSQASETGIRKKHEKSPPDALAKSYILSLKVLKNSEEVDEPNLKLTSLKRVLDNGVVFAIFYKIFMLHLIMQKLIPEKEKDEQMEILQFLPWYHEMLMNDNMGTQKLSQTLYRKIQEDKLDDETSDFEKFLSVFLYADVRGQNYFEVLSEFISSTSKKYILDMSFAKIMSYYNYRSKDKDSDLKYLNMIGDILIKAKGYSREDKSSMMNQYKVKRQNKES